MVFGLLQTKGVLLKDVKTFSGILRDNQMRETSYVMMHLPAQNKTVFICNSYGEATFVVEGMIEAKDLTGLTKQTIQQLLWATRIKFYQSNVSARMKEVEYALFRESSLPWTQGPSTTIEVVAQRWRQPIVSLTWTKQPNKVQVIWLHETMYDGHKCVVISRSWKPVEYTQKTQNTVSDFKKRAENKSGYYPRAWKAGDNYVDFATKELREKFVTEKNLSPLVSDLQTIQTSTKQVLYKKGLCFVISRSWKPTEYTQQVIKTVNDFKKRAKNKSGYYPRAWRSGQDYVDFATEKLREEFVGISRLKKRE